MMNTKLLLVGLLISGLTFSQDAGNGDELTLNPKTVTIQHQTSIEYVLDKIQISVTLNEYVKTDPETQQTSTVEIEEIGKHLLKKLKPFNIKMSNLQLASISDMVQPQQNNMYVQSHLYTNTQKRLLRKTYIIEWEKSTEEIQPFMEGMRLTGVQSIYLNASISDSKKAE